MDTRHLRRRDGIWYVDFKLPARLGSDLGGKRFRFSLETPEYKEAKTFRDPYITPLLLESNEAGLLVALADRIARVNDGLKVRVNECLVTAGARVSVGERGTTATPSGITLGELTQQYLTHLRDNTDSSPASVRKYQATFHAACHILGADIAVNSLADDDVQTFRDALLQMPVGWQKRTTGKATKTARTISPRSVHRELQRLRAVLRWAIDDNKTALEEVPGARVRVHKPPKAKAKVCPSVEQADALLELPCPKTADPHSWHYLPLLARYTAARIGELASLSSAGVVVDHGVRCLQIRGDHLKTESSERLIPIADKLAPHIDRLIAEHPDGRWFPDCGDWTGKDGVMKPGHYFLKAWNVAAKKVGAFSFHCLRVYANNELVRADVDIIDRERICGHVTTRTQAAYTSPELKRYLRALNKIR